MSNPRSLKEMSCRIVNNTKLDQDDLKQIPSTLKVELKEAKKSIICDEEFELDGKKVNFYFSKK